MNLKDKIRNIPDFPTKGILFRDITPLLQDKEAFMTAIERVADRYRGEDIDLIAGIESRGFIIGAPLAYILKVGFIPIRKKGKLPFEVISQDYKLEYGTEVIEMHSDAIKNGKRVLIVDDLLATGGTALAASSLIERGGGINHGFAFLVELGELSGRKVLEGYNVFSLITF